MVDAFFARKRVKDEMSRLLGENLRNCESLRHAALLSCWAGGVKLARQVQTMTSMPTSVAVRAPAKVNLTLRITGRREDGYHLLESLMVPVSLYDDIRLTVGSPGEGAPLVACDVAGPEKVEGGEHNLAARAARAVLDEAQCAGMVLHTGVQIHIFKRIPAGAGLGGGSSDAAAVLATLPTMLGMTEVEPGRMHEIALGLGADVPFCLASTPAVARGIGDELEPIIDFPETYLVVAVAPVHVDTAWAYANALKSLTSGAKGRTDIGLLARSADLSRLLCNDFEAGVTQAFPEIGRVREGLLNRNACGVVMSGSGAAVVGMFDSALEAARAAESLGFECKTFAVQTIAERPAVGAVAVGDVAARESERHEPNK